MDDPGRFLEPHADTAALLDAVSDPDPVVRFRACRLLDHHELDRTVATRMLAALGNLVVTVGRGELIVAHGGIVAVRAGLIDLMLAERGIRRTGGGKRLNPYLGADQRAFLESIPGADVTREQIAHAVQFIACEFIRRGRALAARTGSTWPTDLEDATITHLQRHLGIDFRAAPVVGS